MGKLFIIILGLIIIVGIVNAVHQFGGVIKTTNLSQVLKFQVPSYSNQGQGFFSFETTSTNNKQNQIFTTPPSSSSITSNQTHPQNQNQTSNQNQNQNFNQQPKAPQITPPTGFSLKDLSPFYKKITINYVNPGFYSMGEISLSANYNLDLPLDISGWKIKSNKGEMIIPQAVNNYPPSGFTENSDILLEKNGRVLIYNWPSANGKNLRMNQCIGYLNNTYKFTPSLPCSYVNLYSRDEIATFSGRCQNYILSLGSCRIPTPQDLNTFSNEPACRSFLDRFSYSGCYLRLQNSPNFLSNEWRIWMPGIWSFDQNHDRVLLLDQNDLLVDVYIY